jgi:predicted AlkP superfamily pyrophosphatase or phosphodiesterase
MRAVLTSLFLLASGAGALAHPVLLISIDGLRPVSILQPKDKLPNIAALIAGGTHASGVRDMLPSITYPNHTTLITGVAPALHGITGNLTFDPLQTNQEGWYWYAEDVKVPSLFDAVKAKGGVSANIGWPVTVGQRSITANIPEFWRTYSPLDAKAMRALSTPGLTERLAQATHVPLEATVGLKPDTDVAKGKLMAALIAADHPLFSTIHLSSLDETQHDTGLDTPESRANLQVLDGVVGALVTAARKAEPDLVVALVSDHGFAPVAQDVNLGVAFVEAGLITLDPVSHKPQTWVASPWYGAGTGLVVLKDRNDAGLRARVEALLKKLAADPKDGIAQVIGREEIARRGGGPDADFMVDFASGFRAGKLYTGPLLIPAKDKATHGYFPERPDMRATFVIAGPGIAAGKAMGEIDMRDIAPTLAKIMGVALPTATGKPLF